MPTSISKLFCFGWGYLAQYASMVAQRHHPSLHIAGTSRNPSRENEFLFDDTRELSDAGYEMLQQADAVLVSIPPDENGDKVLRSYKDFLTYMPQRKWVGYCSSLAVYGDHRGGWVDENTPVNPLASHALWRVRAEKQWMESGLPVHIFRSGGIYGPKRSALEQARNGHPVLHKPDHVMNRIHVVDAARAIVASMASDLRGKEALIYNLCDDLPSSREDMMRYAYTVQGLEPPESVLWSEANLSPFARGFFEECKRVRADITKQRLGLEWMYPDYRSGLDALLAQGSDEAGKARQMSVNDNDITARHQIAE